MLSQDFIWFCPYHHRIFKRDKVFSWSGRVDRPIYILVFLGYVYEFHIWVRIYYQGFGGLQPPWQPPHLVGWDSVVDPTRARQLPLWPTLRGVRPIYCYPWWVRIGHVNIENKLWGHVITWFHQVHPNEQEFSFGSEESSPCGTRQPSIYVHESLSISMCHPVNCKELFDEIGTNILTNILK